MCHCYILASLKCDEFRYSAQVGITALLLTRGSKCHYL